MLVIYARLPKASTLTQRLEVLWFLFVKNTLKSWAAEPLRWVHAAVERRQPSGNPEGGWWPAERISRAEALARAAATPLRPGAPADLVAYGEDLLAVPAERLLTLRPARVWVEGTAANG